MTKKPKFTHEHSIEDFAHCSLCLEAKPDDVSPENWARLSVGWTAHGLQIWCTRHDVNVCHIDFEGHRLPALCTRDWMPGEKRGAE